MSNIALFGQQIRDVQCRALKVFSLSERIGPDINPGLIAICEIAWLAPVRGGESVAELCPDVRARLGRLIRDIGRKSVFISGQKRGVFGSIKRELRQPLRHRGRNRSYEARWPPRWLLPQRHCRRRRQR
jgi:hypothetical protein